ncbi:hypothetical protein K503DRAFT_777816 [Rhizopogon vinicolor AM-OR11-026]|uniref:Uncharacterized protein n=1 Tax=Rhizopogon vinicolor AM-OR11-026 TaxID=1314800 RepID=A0A1B7MEW0_9AGAM|nr:hypothetical protein K503DRAFT_777816 [Rhizopogon vinicolor AM-OR11-026]
MPKNFIFISVEFLIANLYVNSYLALLNAQHYLQPSDSNTVNISGFRAHRPSPHNPELENKNLPKSQVNVLTPPCDDHRHHELHPSRPVQAVMPQRPIAVMMEMSSFSPA